MMKMAKNLQSILKSLSIFQQKVLAIGGSIFVATVIATVLLLLPNLNARNSTMVTPTPTPANVQKNNQGSEESLFVYAEGSEPHTHFPETPPLLTPANDTVENAFMLIFDNGMTGDMRHSDNHLILESWYYVDIPNEGILNIEIITTDDLQVDIGIWLVSQGILFVSENRNIDNKVIRQQHLEKGQYHIIITRTRGAGLYTISASISESENTIQSNHDNQLDTINVPNINTSFDIISNTILNTNNRVHLVATWNEGQYRGESTVFERAEGSNRWTMESRSGGTSPIDAVISYENGVLNLIVSVQSPWSYFFHEDGTGFMIHPDGTTRENFTWSSNNANNTG